MKLYSNKQRWKQILLVIGVAIVGLIIWLTSTIANNVKKAELEKIQLWSQAVKKKAELVRLTNDAFNQLSINEYKVYEHVINSPEFDNPIFLTGYLKNRPSRNKKEILINHLKNLNFIKAINLYFYLLLSKIIQFFELKYH